MAQSPFLVYGHVYSSDGTTPLSGVTVYIFNKTLDETKSGNDTKFTELTTNSVGEYQGNLANFDGEYTEGDTIWVSSCSGQLAGLDSYTLVVADGSKEIDLTLRNLEPAEAIRKLLIMKLADPQTGRVSNVKWVRPESNRDKLVKEDYPCILVDDGNESDEVAGIGSRLKERTLSIMIKIKVWSDKNDSQVFTISGGKYEGTKLRDYLKRMIIDVLDEFYIKPRYDQNAIISKFYSYALERSENVPFEEEEQHNVMSHEIEFVMKNITT